MRTSLYTVYLTTAAQKDLASLGSSRAYAESALLRLEASPTAGSILKGSLRQARSLHFTIGGVDFRAAYLLLSRHHECLVFLIGPRRGFYQKAQRRLISMDRQEAKP